MTKYLRTSCIAAAIVACATIAQAQDCTTAEGLLLAPMPEWELFNDAAPQITATQATVRYNLVREWNDQGVLIDDRPAETVGIVIIYEPNLIAQMRFVFEDEMMAGMTEPGPLGYPRMVGMPSTVIGDFQITVDGNGPGTEVYYEAILRCALNAGLAPVLVDWELTE